MKDGLGYCVEIYAQNDVHGRFFDTPYYEGDAGTSLANVSTLLKERREAIGARRVMALDCGDFLQGDMASCYANLQHTHNGCREHLFPRIARYLGLDAVVFGNHDFEAGKEIYGKVHRELVECGIHVLGGNAVCSTTGKGYFPSYSIIEKGGLRIAVVGMTNPCIPKWLPRHLWDGMEFLPLLNIVQKSIDEIRSSNSADVVAVMLHSGIGADDEPLHENSQNQALALARALEGADIIFASHDHTDSCLKIGDTLVMAARSHAACVQKAAIRYRMESGKCRVEAIEGEIVPMGDYPPDKGYLAHFAEDAQGVRQYMEEAVGVLHKDIYTSDALFGVNDYVNMLHAVQFYATGAQISFAAPYAYNAVIKRGAVKRKDIFLLHSCENTLYKIRMSGAQIKGYLEHSYSKWVTEPSLNSGGLLRHCMTCTDGVEYWWPEHLTYNFDAAAGINYVVDITAAPGNMVKISSLADGTPFSMEGIYTVALSSYRTSGGGDLIDIGAGIDPLEELEGITVGKYPLIRDLVEVFLSEGKSYGNVPGHWEFVPKEKAAQAIGRDVRLMNLKVSAGL